MKIISIKWFIAWTVVIALNACQNNEEHPHAHDEQMDEQPEDIVRLTPQQRQVLDLKLGKIEQKNLTATVLANGELELPPQNEAMISSFIGGNVTKINVIEGDKVKTGEVLALLEHPDFAEMQMDYQDAYNRITYLEQEYKRQKKLYEEEVSSGKKFQQVQSDYNSLKARVAGMEHKLDMLGISPAKVRQGEIFRYIPIKTPIKGYIRYVNVAIGKYVDPKENLFEVVNNEHIHADLMVFEKDIFKVKEGQTVKFTVANIPGDVLEATIYSVGKAFESDPKAVHVHAEIWNKHDELIPGMYIKGRILVEDNEAGALPEDAVVTEGEKSYIFIKVEGHGENETWSFRQVPVVKGEKDMGWIAVNPVEELPEDAQIVLNGAYFLLSELTKSEGSHGHHH